MYLHIMTMYCILVTEYEHKLSFSTFTSRQTSLLVSNRDLVLFFMAFMFLPSKLI
jgi:hypothetical protein